MAHAKEAIQGLVKARETGEYCDLKLLCGNQIINVHRVIVCGQSPVFHKACTGKFKENKSRKYVINDFSHEFVVKMVDFLYSGEYTVDAQVPDSGSSAAHSLLFNARMFLLADKYIINSLQDLAKKKFLSSAAVMEDPFDLLSAMPEVYDLLGEAGQELRNGFLDHVKSCIKKAELSPALEETLASTFDKVPTFYYEFVLSDLRAAKGVPKLIRKCDNCGPTDVEMTEFRCKKCRTFSGKHAWLSKV